MKKILTYFTSSVVILFLLSLFGYAAIQSIKGGEKLGIFTKPIKEFVTLPGTIKTVLTSKDIQGVPPTYIPIQDGTQDQDEKINELSYDLFALLAFYEEKNDQWQLQVKNLKTDRLLHSWRLSDSAFLQTGRNSFRDSKPKHSLIYDDKSLVFAYRETPNLFKIDSLSNIVWQNTDYVYHHALNKSADGNFWICSSKKSDRLINGSKPLNYTYENVDGSKYVYRDDQITKIDQLTGKVLYNKSVSDILFENGYESMILGSSYNEWDPIHLNDIQPVLQDGPHWKKDDLFISLRNFSTILHYRPATNEIITLINGPLVHQHDPQIKSDHEISIFNNNYTTIGQKIGNTAEKDHEIKSSEIVVYDYETDSYSSYFKDILNENNLYTPTAGLHYILQNGDLFIDLDDFGRILVLSENGIIYRSIFPTTIKGFKHLTSWTRVYEENPFNLN